MHLLTFPLHTEILVLLPQPTDQVALSNSMSLCGDGIVQGNLSCMVAFDSTVKSQNSLENKRITICNLAGIL